VEPRVRAAERRKGRLGLHLAESAAGESPTAISHALGQVLQGSDGVEVVGNRVYVILDEPTEDVLRALDPRLKESPDIDRRRTVVLGWDPSKGRAAELVGRAEGILHQETTGENLRRVSDSPRGKKKGAYPAAIRSGKPSQRARWERGVPSARPSPSIHAPERTPARREEGTECALVDTS
jgi:hypothetical protein